MKYTRQSPISKERIASSSCSVLVFVAILLQFLLLSESASPNYIDAICQRVTDKAFCLKTLNAYPPAAKAIDKYQAAEAVLSLGVSNAEKSRSFAEKAGNENLNLKKQFTACQDAYMNIILSLKGASGELKVSPDTANYDVMVCYDQTNKIKDLVGQNTDKASQTLITMTLMVEKIIAIGVGATLSVGG